MNKSSAGVFYITALVKGDILCCPCRDYLLTSVTCVSCAYYSHFWILCALCVCEAVFVLLFAVDVYCMYMYATVICYN